MKIKAKVVLSEWCNNFALYLPDDVVYDTRENDYIVIACADDETQKYIEQKIGKVDEFDLPNGDDYYLYDKVPDKYEIDVPTELIAKSLQGKLGVDILINPGKTEKALFMAINEGCVLNDKGEAVEPDSPDSPLRKEGLI